MTVLLAGILVFHAGWYMLLPFLAVLLTGRRHLSPAEVGLVMAAQSLALLLGSLAGGALADRAGRKLTLVGGLGFRALGVGGLGVAAGLPGLLLAALVAGFGGGLYGPAAKAAIATLAAGAAGAPGAAAGADSGRTAAFSLRGIAANIGTSTGPLIGSLLMKSPMIVLFGAAAALHAALGLATWVLLDDEKAGEGRGPASLQGLLADRPYVAFTAVTVLAWALFTQLAIAVPLYAREALGLEASIGLLWTFSSLAVIGGQVAVTRTLLSRLQPMSAMAIGAALLGGGLAAVGLARNFAGLLAAVLLFVFGEMFLVPTADTTVSQMVRAGAVGSYFGIASFAWGLGEGIGNLTGGALMQFALRSGHLYVPWVAYGVFGLAVGGLYWALRRWRSMRARLARG
jgi:MFS family permease